MFSTRCIARRAFPFAATALCALALTFPAGAQNLSLPLDGVNDYVDADDVVSVFAGESPNFTMEGWFFIDQDNSGEVALMAINTDYEDNFNVVLFDADDGKFGVRDRALSTQIDGIVEEISEDGPNAYPKGRWYHVAYTLDQDGNAVLYVDGVAEIAYQSTTTVCVTQVINSCIATEEQPIRSFEPINLTAHFSIGQEWDPSGRGNFLKGRVDEVRIWSEVRSASEISNNRFAILDASEANLEVNWSFDDIDGKGDGSSLTDGAGSYTATLEGVSTLSGPDGDDYLLSLDGSDGYVEANSIPGAIAGAFTIEGWFWPEADASLQTLFAVNTSGGSNRLVVLYASDEQEFRIVTSSGTAVITDWRAPAYRWYHVAVTVTSADEITLHVNGEAEESVTSSVSISSTDLFSIGQEFDADDGELVESNFLTGRLDEVRVWSTARSGDQIRETLGTELTGSETALVAYWPFDDDGELSVTDATGNGHTGRLVDLEDSAWGTSDLRDEPALATREPGLIPADGAENVDIGQPLRLEFVMPVQAGSGTIEFLSGATVLESLTVPGSNVEFAGHSVLITPPDGLEPGSLYTLSVPAGAVESVWGESVSLLNVDFTSGSTGASLSLSGEGGGLIEDALFLLGEYTVEGWFLTESSASQGVFALVQSSGNHLFLARVDSDGRARFLHRPEGGNSGGYNLYSTELVDDGAWHHFAAVVSEDFLRWYIDGELVAEETGPIDLTSTGFAYTVDVEIGQQSATAAYFDGHIDELRVWNSVRTQAEITANLDREILSTSEHLLAYWPMDEGTGSSAADVAGGLTVSMAANSWGTDANPMLASLSPVDDETHVDVATDLILTFDRDVSPGSGDLELYADGVLLATYAATDTEVTFSGATVTIDHGLQLAIATEHHVLVSPDFVSGSWTGFSSDTSWNFGTTDEPEVSALSPAAAATGLPWRFPLEITFNQDVTVGSGDLVLYDSDGAEVERVAVTGSGVVVDGPSLSFSFDTLVEGSYYVLADAGAVVGSFGTEWTGISDTSVWTFSVGAGPVTTPGNALSLAGGGDHLELGASAAPDLINAEEGTIEMWFRQDTETSQALLFHAGNGDGFGGGIEELQIYITEGELWAASYGAVAWYIGGADVELGVWNHAALVWDAPAGTAILYLNGVAIDSSSMDAPFGSSGLGGARLGYHAAGGSSDTRAFIGLVDEVRFWDVPRSAHQIRGAMRTTVAGTADGLVSYYQFESDARDPVSGFDGEPIAPTLVSSTLPLAVQVASAYEVAGSVTFGETGVTADYQNQSGQRVYVSHFSESASGAPTSALGSEYWVIERFTSGLFRARLTFEYAGSFTAAQQTVPEQIKLYRREVASSDQDAWTLEGSAVEVTTNSATFSDIRGFSQFVLATGEVLEGELAVSLGDYEDRVELSWPQVESSTPIIRIDRELSGTTETLSYLASDETSYVDWSATPGVEYTYCMVLENDADNTAVGSDCAQGLSQVRAPENLDASVGTRTDGVQLFWTDRSEVETHFRISRAPIDDQGVVGTFEDLSLSTEEEVANLSSYLDEAAAVGQVYQYCVAAVDQGGYESSATCVNDGYRASVLPPTLVDASDGQYDGRVVVSWVDQVDADDPENETAFRIYRSDQNASLADTSPDIEEYVDESGVPGTTYSYCVVAVASDGSESVEQCDDGGQGTLAAPTDAVASYDSFDDRIEITWTDPGDTEDGFRVYRSVVGGTDSEEIAHVDADVESFTDVDILADTEYAYCIDATATREIGGEDKTVESGQVCAVGRKDAILAVTGAGATEADDHEDRVVVTWENPSTTAVLTKITRSIGPDFATASLIKTTVATTTLFEDQRAASGVEYRYCLTNVDKDGTEDDTPVCADGSRALNPPTGGTAAAEEEDFVLISWSDRSEAETGYRVYRSPEDGSEEAVAIGAVSAGVESFEDYTGTPGVDYTYAVVAFDDYGESASDSDVGRRDLEPPTNVSATDGTSETEVIISWEDNSRVETGFAIYRARTADLADDAVVDLSGDPIATLAARLRTWTDESAEVGETYRYAVVTVDDYGTSEAVEDDGYTTLLPPVSVNASDSYSDRVEVTWVDQSAVASAFRITRSPAWDSGTVDVDPGVQRYADGDVDANTTYTYCVQAVSGDRLAPADADACSEDDAAREDAQDAGVSPQVTEYSTVDLQQLTPGDAEAGRRFGVRVALSDNYAFATGLAESGEDYLYVYGAEADGTYSEVAALLLPTAPSGLSAFDDMALVSIRSDDTKGTDAGRAYLFGDTGSGWEQMIALEASDATAGDRFGRRGRIAYDSGDGSMIAISAPRRGDGAVYIFESSGSSTWGTCDDGVCTETHILTYDDAEDDFGRDLALYDGTLLVTDPGAESVEVFDRQSSSDWEHNTTWEAPEADAGFGVVELFGDAAFVGASSDSEGGSVFVYERSTSSGSWQHVQTLTENGGQFGYSIAAWNSVLVVGAPEESVSRSREGAAYRFERAQEEDGLWESSDERLVGVTRNTSAAFGYAVAVSAERTLVGAYRDDANGNESGAAYLSVSDVATVTSPGNVVASDGTFDGRIQLSWTDGSSVESGYRIYRNGKDIDQTSANATSYSDFDAEAGILHEYCVEAVSSSFLPSERVCDLGYRPANGSISGSVTAAAGAGIDGVSLCLDPTPGQALLLDGSEGHGLIESLSLGEDLEAFTLSLWVRSGSGEGTAVSYVPGDLDGILALRELGDLVVAVDGETTTSQNIDVADGEWHHLAATWEAETGSLVLYVDAEERHSQTIAQGSVLESGGVLAMGQELVQAGNALVDGSGVTGRLDEVRLWSHVRSQSEIAADMLAFLQGDEEGLVGYWPLDQGHDEGAGGVEPDLSSSANHLALLGGAYGTSQSAPVVACGITDEEGNYSIQGIPYGSSRSFSLVPSKDTRSFEPASKTLSLSADSPVQNEVIFSDVSSFTVAGVAQYEYDGTVCPARDVDIITGAWGEAGVASAITEKDGAFSVALDIGDRFLRAERTDAEGDGLEHTFSPDEHRFYVEADSAGLIFTDNATRELEVFVGGNCSTDIGEVLVRIYTADGCFDETYSVEGWLTLELPPQEYLAQVVEVVDPPDQLDEADVLDYFDQLGVLKADLSVAADTLEVIYEAPLQVSIEFPSAQSAHMCAIDDYAVIEAGTGIIDIPISVYQDYGADELCPVDGGTIEIFDEISAGITGSTVLELDDGLATYRIDNVGDPNILAGLTVDGIDRSYQKPLTVTAEVEGRDAVTEVAWAVVEGTRTRTSEFTTLITDPTPVYILRDPPGDSSSASWEEGSETCYVFKEVEIWQGDETLSAKKVFGREGSVGGEVGGIFGGVITLETTESVGWVKASAGGAESLTHSDIIESWCIKTSETIKTSSGSTFVGESADIIVGTGFNLIFAAADELAFTNSCEISVEETVVGGLSGSDPFHTTYSYTHGHIEDNLIPQIEDLMAVCDEQEDCESEVADPDGGTVPLEDALEMWETQLSIKDELTAQALEGTVENRSFSAGASYSAKHTRSDKNGFTRTTSGTFKAGLDVGAKVKFLSGTEWNLKVNYSQTWKDDETDSSSETTTTSYTLADNDIGDSFTVDIGSDPDFESPVFALRSGITSWPWEEGSQKRDYPTLTVSPATSPESPMIGVDPDSPALFTLGLGNLSESKEQREYVLKTIHTSNPHGATMKANGGGITGGLSFYVDSDSEQSVTLEVSRGPSRYKYHDLQIMVVPPKEYSIWQSGGELTIADTISVSVEFDAVCTDIAILRPFDSWSRNAGELDSASTDYNPLKLILNDFRLTSLDTDETADLNVTEIGIEYRASGAASWSNLVALQDVPDDGQGAWDDGIGTVLDADNTSYTYVWSALESSDGDLDGSYDLRAYSRCDNDVVYSEVAAGVVDTTPPQILGNPQPADQLLNLGDEISVEFNEDISCSTVKAGENVTLSRVDDGSAVEADVVCDGRKLVITPTGSVSELENVSVKATLHKSTVDTPAVSDALGNPVASSTDEDITWDFRVSRSAVAFTPANASIAVSKGFFAEITATLANGRANEITFETAEFDIVDIADADNTAVLTPGILTDTIISGGSAVIGIDVPRTLEVGTYEGTMTAALAEGSTALGQVDFAVTVDVLCRLPTEVFDFSLTSSDVEQEVVEAVLNPANFEYNMTYTAYVAVDDDLEADGTDADGDFENDWEISTDEGDAVLAFVGDEVRGLDFLTEVAPGVFVVNMVIYSDEAEGEVVSFQIWDKSQCLLLSDVDSSFLFEADGLVGSATPVTIQSPRSSSSTQAIALEPGWNWFSHNRAETDPDAVFATLPLSDGDRVKSHDQGTFAEYDYDSGTWDGPLELNAGEGYQVKLSSSGSVLLSDDATIPMGIVVSDAITIVEGWNWIGYLPQSALSVDEALETLTAFSKEGDLIKSQVAFAQFISDIDGAGTAGWVGSLETMRTGAGYQFYRSGTGTATLTYPTSGSATAAASLVATKSGTGDSLALDPHAFQYDMSVTARLEADLGPSDSLQVRALVDGEVRGVATPVWVAGVGADLAFITVYGLRSAGETVSFDIVDARTGQVLPIAGQVAFKHNTIVGTPRDPLALVASTVTGVGEDTLPSEFALYPNYPNPFNPVTTLVYDLPSEGDVVLTIHDVLGRRVARLVDGRQPAGQYKVQFDAGGLSSGVYLYRLSFGGREAVGRMLLLKEE